MTFIDLLKQFNIPYREQNTHHHVRSGWVGVDCPSCSPNWGHFRLGYNLRGGFMTCWACGPTNVFSYLATVTGLHRGKIAQLIKGLVREVAPPEFKVQGVYTEPKGLQPLMKQHIRYLKGRGYDLPGLCRLWGVDGGTGRTAELSWRIFIPIYYRGERVSWTTRSLSDSGVRYISASPEKEKYQHKELLYGEDYVRNTVIVCEGPMDVWKIGPGAVCTFGTSFSRSQVLRLTNYPVRYICYDAQPEAQKRAIDLARQLNGFDGRTSIVELETGKDAGDIAESELRALRRLLDR